MKQKQQLVDNSATRNPPQLSGHQQAIEMRVRECASEHGVSM